MLFQEEELPAHSLPLPRLHAHPDEPASLPGTAKPALEKEVPGHQLELGWRCSQKLPVFQGHAESA